MSLTNLNPTSKVVVPMNVKRRRIVEALSQLMLIFDPKEAHRALKCQSLADWSWKGLALYPHAVEKKNDLIKQLQVISSGKDQPGFSIIDLEYFSRYYTNMRKDNLTAVSEMEAEFNAGSSPLSALDVAKNRVDLHFDRMCMTMLIDILNTEVARRNVLAQTAREEANKARLAHEEENKKRIEELRAQEQEAEKKRVEYIAKKISEAKAVRSGKANYVPPVKRQDFTTKVSDFADLVVINRKAGKFVAFEAVTKAEAIEIAGIDQKSFEKAYKTAKVSAQDTILTLADYRQIAFKRNGAAVQYLVRS